MAGVERAFAVTSLVSETIGILETLQRFRDAPRAFVSIRAEVLALQGVLNSFEKLFKEDDSRVVAVPPSLLGGTRVTLEEIAIPTAKYQSMSTISRAMLGVLRQDRLDFLRKELGQCRASFVLILSDHARYVRLRSPLTWDILKLECHDQMKHMENLNAAQIQIYERRLRESIEQTRKEKILAWVSPYNFYAAHSIKTSSIFPGTCKWLLKTSQFSNWLDSKGGIFVLDGKRMLKASL